MRVMPTVLNISNMLSRTHSIEACADKGAAGENDSARMVAVGFGFRV